MTENVCNILLDSGAFSAWRRGIDLPLSEYIRYCTVNKDNVDAYVNMDCIPGENGKMDHSQSSIEKSAAKSYDNLQEMKAAGLSPVPVFHQGERFYWLDKMLEDGETYVGISPYMRAHQSEIIKWMDKCFTRITDSKGRPLIKTHGFGVTACRLCIRYPWYSVDSTSWSVGGGYGSILVPKYRHGKPDFTKPPLTLRISARDTDQGSRSFDALPPAHQEVIRKAAEESGVSMMELRNTFTGRWKFNVRYHLGMAEACSGHLFKHKVKSLFDTVPTHGREGYMPDPMRMYFATVLHTLHHNVFLTDNNIKNRLLSYAFLREMPDDFIQEYTRTGLVPQPESKKAKRISRKTYDSEPYRVRRVQSTLRRAIRQDELNESR